MEIIDSNANDKSERLTDKVKKVITWLEWESFTIDDICTGLDIHGHKGEYNIGSIKNAVLPALVRSNFIRPIEGENPPAFLQVPLTKKPNDNQKPAIDAPTVREANGAAPKTKRSEPQRPPARPIMQALMIVEAAPIDAATLNEKLCHYTGCDYEPMTARRFLWNLAHQKLAKSYKQTGQLQRKYELLPRYFEHCISRQAVIKRAMPECKKEIGAAFEPYKNSKRKTDKKPSKIPEKFAQIAAVLISANRPLLLREIVKQINTYTKENLKPNTISALLTYYKTKYPYVISKPNGPTKTRNGLYSLGPQFFNDFSNCMDDVANAIPELKTDIEKQLSRIYNTNEEPAEANAPTDEPLEKPTSEQIENGQETMPAADLGNAVIQYCQELKNEIKRLKSNIKNTPEYKDLKYKIDDMTGVLITKNSRIAELENKLKKTKNELTNAKKSIEKNEKTIAKLNNKIGTMQVNVPKTSFKMSEVANIKRALDGDKSLSIPVPEAV